MAVLTEEKGATSESEPRGGAPRAPGGRALTGGSLGLVGILALAAVLRLPTLDYQSFWFDEVVTADLVDRSLWGMLSEIPGSESTPPLYYVLAWVWAQLFGTGEVALRSLSAIFGLATVGAMYVAGRALMSRRVGLIAAALAAVHPLLIWYSQEARAYALLALLSSLSLVFLVRALRGDARAHAWWAVATALAIVTHYFGLFLAVAAGAALLLRSPRVRHARLAVLGVTAAAAAVAPLLLYQRGQEHLGWIGEARLSLRVFQAVSQFLNGELLDPIVAIVTLWLFVAVVYMGVRHVRADARRTAGLFAAIGFGAILIPFLVELVSPDLFVYKNLIVAWPPLALAAAVLLGGPPARRFGIGATLAVCALLVVVQGLILSRDDLLRPDWREVAETLGPARAGRVLVVAPEENRRSVEHYRSSAVPLEGAGVRARDVVLIGFRDGPRASIPEQPVRVGGLREIGRRRVQRLTLIHLRADAELELSASRLTALMPEEPGAVLVER